MWSLVRSAVQTQMPYAACINYPGLFGILGQPYPPPPHVQPPPQGTRFPPTPGGTVTK